MEIKLFFISLGLLVYTVLLKYFFGAREKIKTGLTGLLSAVFHMGFCAITGLVVGMIFSTLSDKPEMISVYSLAGAGLGAVFGLLHFIIFAGGDGSKKNSILKSDLEWSDTSWSAILLASLLMFFIIQAFKIPSGSMRETLLEGDHLFVNKFIYGIHIPFADGKRIQIFRKVRSKDVIIFQCPPAALSPAEREKGITKDFIKRCLAVGGDTVEIKDKNVYVNGNLVEEPYTNFVDNYIFKKINLFAAQEEYQKAWENGSFVNLPVRDNFGPVKIPEGYYFAMGDNRDRSFDSRFWGPVPDKNLKGRALVIYWPPARVRIIK